MLKIYMDLRNKYRVEGRGYRVEDKSRKAVVLLSGGLDSTTALGWALKNGYDCFAVTISYRQRHLKEISRARKIAKLLGVNFFECNINLPWLNVSSLIDRTKKLPDVRIGKICSGRIPSTYVPGRNLIFASIGVSLADSISAGAVVLGVNAIDYSGYPDCRHEFYAALEKAVNLGTKTGVIDRGNLSRLKHQELGRDGLVWQLSDGGIKLLTPLINLSKSQIIQLAVRLKMPLEWTWSCYRGDDEPCGRCDSCKLRAKGFKEAGIPDPAIKGDKIIR